MIDCLKHCEYHPVVNALLVRFPSLFTRKALMLRGLRLKFVEGRLHLLQSVASPSRVQFPSTVFYPARRLSTSPSLQPPSIPMPPPALPYDYIFALDNLVSTSAIDAYSAVAEDKGIQRAMGYQTELMKLHTRSLIEG